MRFIFSTTTPTAALRPFVVVALSGLCLAACGGDGQERAEAAATPATAATSVRLEGCVVDALWLSAPGVAVHARGADGRAIGATVTDSRGMFQINVPAHSRVVLDTVAGGQGGAVLDTGSTPLAVPACLNTAA